MTDPDTRKPRTPESQRTVGDRVEGRPSTAGGDEATVAWQGIGNLWIPYRIRGSWRGVLG
jgi:hypothetical protein